MELQKGQKCKLADLTGSGQLRISVTVSLPGSEADVTCFGVDGAGKLSDDRYFIFYNQTSSPEGAVSMPVSYTHLDVYKRQPVSLHGFS